MKFIMRYTGSIIYDFILFFSLCFAFTAFIILLRAGQAPAVNALWYPLSLLALGLSYYAYSIYHGGQTIGMKAWQLQVTAADGTPAELKHIIMRFCLFLPSLPYALLRLKSPNKTLSLWSQTKIAVLASHTSRS